MNNNIRLTMIVGFLTMLAGCGGGSDPKNTPVFTTPSASSPAASVALVATPDSILTTGTTALSALVTTANGSNVPNGTRVTFSLSSGNMGRLTSTSVTTSAGQASTTFTAGTVPGIVTVTATSGTASITTPITITAPAAGTVEFISATPQAIGVRGSGQSENSTVRFRIKDTSGQPAINGTTVNFEMTGPSGGRSPSLGGEYIGTDDGTPTTASVPTVNGEATVSLISGSIAGTVTITARVATPNGTASASSSAISIGGAIPSASHFNLATTRFNLPGLVLSNAQATISAFIADRFSNYNILAGTTVSFYAEGGAIDASNAVDATGKTSVQFRTQSPLPANVAITAAEQAAIAGLNATYGLAIPLDGSVHPRDGWVTVLATVNGEESFTDTNGNGLYDPGVDTFMDLGEPYIDINDNGVRDNDEFFVDANNNGVYDGPNGVWDGPGCTGTACQQTKMIWTTIKLAFTGDADASSAGYCAVTPGSFAIPNGGKQDFKFMVGDRNLNRLVPKTTITVTATKGTLSGQKTYTVPDGIGGPTEISFSLLDPDADTTVDTAAVSIVVTPPVAEGVTGCEVSVTGTIQ